jgi:hypothetical protein
MSKQKKKIETQKHLASVDVFEHSIVATVYGTGAAMRKLITPNEAVQIFSVSGQNRGVVQWLDFGKGIVRHGIYDGDVIVHYVRKAKPATITVAIGKRKRSFKIKLPNLLAVIRRRNGQWIGFDRVLAFRGRLKKNTSLYAPPVPNIYGDGSVCMGSVKLTTADSLIASEVFERDFLGSLFSDHLDSSGLRNSSGYRDLFDALTKTKGKIPFSVLRKVASYGELLNED